MREKRRREEGGKGGRRRGNRRGEEEVPGGVRREEEEGGEGRRRKGGRENSRNLITSRTVVGNSWKIQIQTMYAKNLRKNIDKWSPKAIPNRQGNA